MLPGLKRTIGQKGSSKSAMPYIARQSTLSHTALFQTQDNTYLYLLSFYYYFKKNLKNQVNQATPSNKLSKSQYKIHN